MKQLLLILFISLLLSCEKNQPQIVTLYTDLPEFLPFIENFNQNNDKTKIIITSDTNSDLVLFRGQSDNSPIDTKRVDNLLINRINKESFFEDILNSVIVNNEIYLLPLTFDIQGLIYHKNKRTDANKDIDEFLNEKNIIFSPYWDNKINIWYYLTSFPELTKDNNYFDFIEFKNSISSMNIIFEDRTDKWDISKFNDKYMHLSPELLISKSIIDYYFYDFSKYIKISNENNNKISFSRLSRNNLSMIKDEMTFIGINNKSKQVKLAESVLEWIFNEENQKKYILNNINNSGQIELFNNELSTLKNVTRKTLTTFYPEIDSLIIDDNQFITPYKLPKLWNSLKTTVYIPMLNNVITLPEEQWNKKYLEYFNDWSKRNNK